MIGKLKQFSFIAVLLVVVISFSGCVALMVGAAVGAGGYVYAKGTIEKQVGSSAESVHKATMKTLDDMDIVVQNDLSDRLTSKITARDSFGKDVKIDIKAVTERRSKIRIRYGKMGNEAKSKLILNEIENRL